MRVSAMDRFATQARLHCIEKELKELYSVRHMMRKFADKGSEVDKANLPFVEASIAKLLIEERAIKKD